MKRLSLVVALVACACPSKKTERATGGGGGTGTGSQVTGSGEGPPPAGGCEAIRAKVEQLYRAEAQAQAKEQKRVEEAVADNTAMVMGDCAKAPAKIVACVTGAATVKDIEITCLVPIDDEGTEGEALKK
jgi:hypothetical protein